jgi:serine protease AprX
MRISNIRHLSARALALALLALGALTIAPAAQTGGSHGSIITFKKPIDQKLLQRLAHSGFDVTRHLTLINAVAGRGVVAGIAAWPEVKSIAPDLGVTKTDAFTVGDSMAGAALQAYDCLGTGIGVAVVDSGVSNVSDFGQFPAGSGGNRLAATVDFTGTGQSDQCGHGTHVAGIIAGDGEQSTGKHYSETFTGVAPGASLIGVKVLDQNGSGSVSNVISGIQWVVSHAAQYKIRVMNLSMGHPVVQSYATDPLNQAVEAAWHAGIVVVVAAGNGGRLNATPTPGAPNDGYGTAYGSVECPGNDPYVITVGATKQMDSTRADDQIASYSGRGPSVGDLILKPDLIAPGNHVISVEASGSPYLVETYGPLVEIQDSLYCTVGNGSKYSGEYMMLSGTSMATPTVSGAVAQMLQQQPNLTPDTVKARLMVSADKWADPLGNQDACTYGAGYLDVLAAMNCTVVAGSACLSPCLSQSGSGTWSVNLNSSIYGQRAMWGTGITNLETIWGQRAMWGTSFVQLNANQTMCATSFNLFNSAELGATSAVDCTGNAVLVSGE